MTLLELLKPERLTAVVDIGANPIDGDPPYKSMLQAGLCTVTGFEPQEEALTELLRRKGPNERYFPYAVGDGGVHTLNICHASGMTSFFEPEPATADIFALFKKFGQVIRQVDMQTRSLNDITEIEQLDFLKIDIQGGELAVFKSGGGSFPRPWLYRPRCRSYPCIKGNPRWATSMSSCATKASCRIVLRP